MSWLSFRDTEYVDTDQCFYAIINSGLIDSYEETEKIENIEYLAKLISFVDLSEKQKKVIYLKYFEDLSFDEISEEMGFTKERARQAVLSALGKLNRAAQITKYRYNEKNRVSV